MFENEILDEGFLKELMLSELDIDIQEIKPVDELQDEEGTSIVGTFANPNEVQLFHKILGRMGIASKINVDPTMGNMDPLFNAGTQTLLTREDDVQNALKIIDAVDRNMEKHRKEKDSSGYTKFLFSAIVIAVVAILILWLLLKNSGPF